MTVPSGTRLGPYEILAPLGAGGMGEVYKARDARVDRLVALKVLPQDFLEGEERRARFEREAKLLASLNHPGIATLYTFEEIPGSLPSLPTQRVLVMELVEGETLAARLRKGPLPPPQVLRIGAEIAASLQAAHRKGIVHRDLKPANVMLTRSGVKLLDFGLARAVAPSAGAAGLSALTTEDRSLTSDGRIVGTPQYMAPEQLEGKEADARTDVFALGATLYEMATGRKAFPAANTASLISAILTTEPAPVSALRREFPTAFDRLVATCLAKDPDDRWQSAGDVAKELRWTAENPAQAPVARAPRGPRALIPWVIASLAFLLAAAGFFRSRRAEMPAELTRFKILAPPGQNFMAIAALSPDARRVLFLLRDDGGRNRLAIRPLDGLDFRILPGTEDARGGFWSPDSSEIGFFSDGKLKRMSADGGPAQTVCDSGGGVWGAWSPLGTILFATHYGGALEAVPAAGGPLTQATALDEAAGETHQSQPSFLPDGRHFIYFWASADHSKRGIRVGSLDSKETRPLFESDSSATYAEPGYLVFARGDAVLAWRFDPKALRLVGEPFPAFENVHWWRGDDFLSLSAAGNRVVYVSWALRRRLVWVDRKGRELGSLGDVAGYADVRISPDARRVAVTVRRPSNGGQGDIWVLDVGRGTSAKLTSDPTDDFNPAWFPGGERLAYVSDRFGFYNLFARPADGGLETLLVRSDADKVFPSILPDGRHVLLNVIQAPVYLREIVSLDDPKDAVRLGRGPLSEEHPVISADGRLCAFDSIEAGQREVYVQPVPDGPRTQVSIGGGQMPVWNRNGKELFYAARNGTLMSVALRPEGSRLEAGEPQPLFPLQFDLSGELPWHLLPYDVTPDGQKFLVIRRAPGVEPDGVVVVTNWTQGLRTGR